MMPRECLVSREGGPEIKHPAGSLVLIAGAEQTKDFCLLIK